MSRPPSPRPHCRSEGARIHRRPVISGTANSANPRIFLIAATLFFLGPALGFVTPEAGTVGFAAAQVPEPPAERSMADTAAVSNVLDDFHEAASRADADTYFGLFAPNGVFLGTDPGERWTVAEFRDYARPYFQRGRGWTYVPFERHVRISADGSTAWFDEMLRNEGLGITRGTGVLVEEDGAWKVAQYHLTIPVPNEIAGEVVEMIRARDRR